MYSDEEMMKMLKMRLDGYTLEEIGNEFGITKQAVNSLFYRRLNTESVEGKVSKCIYPGLTRWLKEHKLSLKKFCEKTNFPAHYNHFLARLMGKIPFRIDEIKLILAYTGLTFEEAFGEEIKPVRKEG